MTVTLELDPDIEEALQVQAQAQGVSITKYVEQIVTREARHSTSDSVAPKSLVQFFRESPLVGLELDFERDRDMGRDICL